MTEKTIVLDNGSGTVYAGFAEEDNPISVCPNLVGTSTKNGGSNRINFTDFSTEEDYRSFLNENEGGSLKIAYPIEHGVVQNWDAMETVWGYVLNDLLNVDPKEYNMLLTEPVMNPKLNRERMATVLFEKFNLPAIHVSPSALLPLYSAGLTTGIVLDCGDGVIQTVPVWGGYPLSAATSKADMGGREVSTHLGRIMRDNGHAEKSLEVLQYIKEKACFVAPTTQDADDLSTTTEFRLPDGTTLAIGSELHMAPELLFNPSIIDNSDKVGVQVMLYKSIMKTNMDIRKDLYGSIVLSGGSTLFPGFLERLSQELASLLPQKAKLTIRATPERNYSTWCGGSVLASLSNFSRLLVSKQEFEEVGPAIMHKSK